MPPRPPRRRYGPSLSLEQLTAARQLYEQGESFDQIAARYGVAGQTMRKRLIAAGVEPRAAGAVRGRSIGRAENAAIGQLPDDHPLAEIDAAIVQARLAASMLDGQCRVHSEPWAGQSSLADL